MSKGDKYILLRRANEEWWDVIYYDYRKRSDKRFYVPGKYTQQLDIVVSEDDCDHDGMFYYSLVFVNKVLRFYTAGEKE